MSCLYGSPFMNLPGMVEYDVQLKRYFTKRVT